MRYTSLSCSPERFAYLQARRRETVSIHVLRLLVLIAFLFLWEMGARWGWVGFGLGIISKEKFKIL